MASKGYKVRRAIFRVALFLCFLVIFYFLVRPLAVIDHKIAGLLEENTRLKAEKKRIEADLSKLDSEIEKGKTLAGFEQKARERLQMIYEGEQIYICKDPMGSDLRPDNEINLIQSDIKEKSVFAKVWDMILSIFR